MSAHPLSTLADPNAYLATVMAVRKLAGRQVLTTTRAWELMLQPDGSSDVMPAEARVPTRQLLAEFGYREYLVTPVGGHERRTLWMRDDWLPETIEEVPMS